MRLTQSDITSITEKCFNGEPAACSNECPFGLDVRSLMEKAARGKWAAAYKLFRNSVVFPGVVSRLCAATCKMECARVDLGDDPIDIPLIERAIIAYSGKKNAESYAIPPKEQSIAIIGGGVSGLACALDLAQKKYLVTVFDKNEGPGGALRRHPDFDIFADDLSTQFSAASITWSFNRDIADIETLVDYDAVYIATGSGGSDFGLLDGYDPISHASKEKGVFLGGGITGAMASAAAGVGTVSGMSEGTGEGVEAVAAMSRNSLADAIIAGRDAARHIEGYLQTGRTDAIEPVSAAPGTAPANARAAATLKPARTKLNCSRHVYTRGFSRAARVRPSSAGEYTEDEAVAEASRCMLCDCAACIDACEMLDTFHKSPRKIAMEIFTDSKVTPPYSSHTITRETYSCNICSHCKSVCPEGINIGNLFLLSRRDRYESGAAPYAMHDFWLREMDFNTAGASFYSTPDNTHASCEYVFYPGCQLGANEPAHVLKTYKLLTSHLDCGVYLGCCGAPAHWAGDRERFESNANSIRTASKELGNPIFIFACATCETIFSEALPEIRRTSLYSVLAGIAAPAASPGEAPEAQSREFNGNQPFAFSAAAVFDPCSARSDGEMMSSVRTLAAKYGISLDEIPKPDRCCGYGGLIRGGNPGMYDKSLQNLGDDPDRPYIVYCSNCKNVFRSRGKECAHILDIALGLPLRSESPVISERRRNSMNIKAALARELKNEVFTVDPQPWDDINLVIGDELAEEIDRKLISADDIKEAIWRAEKSGDKFVDSDNGSISVYLVRNVLTYWVRYTPLESSAFRILDAYYHRMRFEPGNV